MRILFLGDVVGKSGCESIRKNLKKIFKQKNIDFVIVNGENAAEGGVGISEKISNELFSYGVDVITTGNHVWDLKETAQYISRENKLLRPFNLPSATPGEGFGVYQVKNGLKIGVLNLMGNIFMKKCENVFESSALFLKNNELKKILIF